jgi:Tol biopolymer transport system component
VGGTLFGVPFDLARLEVTGSAAPVIEQVGSTSGEGSAQYSVSRDGTLVYASGSGASRELAIVWLDRQGTLSPLWADRQNYRQPNFSPDGKTLAVSVENEDQWDVWLYDIERDVPTRLTFNEADEGAPVWSADSAHVYFNSNREGVMNIFRKSADGSGVAERMTTSDRQQYPYSVSSDGKTLALGQQGPQTNWDVWTLPLDDSAEPEPFLETEHVEVAPMFSPDNRWLAYTSDESGQMEIYIRPRTGRGKWQLSNGGGLWPMWSPDGHQVFYRWGDTVHVVSITVEDNAVRASRAEVLVEAKFASMGPNVPITLAPDGRFVVFQGDEDENPEAHEHVQIIYNWFNELNDTFAPR